LLEIDELARSLKEKVAQDQDRPAIANHIKRPRYGAIPGVVLAHLLLPNLRLPIVVRAIITQSLSSAN